MIGIRNYAIVTTAYWGFMVTDGALRMLVLLHFNQLGYSPLQLSLLFVLYEAMGITTNLAGGWIASRFGLTVTLYAGLSIQIAALLALSFLDPGWSEILSVVFVLIVQGASGIAKDLSKMSAKTVIKVVVPKSSHSTLFAWVALLTGSKNALKGIGFFLGGVLLSSVGFVHGLWWMAGVLGVLLIGAAATLPRDMGKIGTKAKISQVLSKTGSINLLSAARLFLFGARDVWFVVGLPMFLYSVLGWTFIQVGTFLASWIIGYGAVQAIAPKLAGRSADGRSAEVRSAQVWIVVLTAVTLAIAAGIHLGWNPAWTLIGGLSVFGLVFAVNSSVHSYLVLAFSDGEKVAMDIGFYYMANAAGRLVGTLLSGVAYQAGGMLFCLLAAAGLLAVAAGFTFALRPGTASDAGALDPKIKL